MGDPVRDKYHKNTETLLIILYSVLSTLLLIVGVLFGVHQNPEGVL
jgi:hypothetical protein